MHANGRLADGRAFVLAHPAADAQVVDDDRALKDAHLTRRKTRFCQLELDRLLGEWAHLLADDALLLLDPRQAAILIDLRPTDDLLLLACKGERGDGFNRTALAAGVAAVITVSQPGDQNGGPEPLDARLAKRWLEGGCWTGAHALAAAHALGVEGIRVGSGRVKREGMIER